MKYLILGSGSFAGQALFNECLKKGINVFGINRSLPLNDHFWPWIKNQKKYISSHWFSYNINSSLDEMIKKIQEINPDIVIDFMGQGMVAQSWQNPENWYETNISNKSKLLQVLLNLNLKKYIRIGTPEVFGSNKEFISEEQSFNPSTPYSVSHCAIDMHLRCLGKQYNFPYVIARFANFYGIGQQLHRVIPRLFLSCYSGEKFILDGLGKSKRSFIHSNDFTDAIFKIINSNLVKEEYNFSTQEEISISELVERICQITKVDKNKIIRHGPERPGKDMFYRMDINKAKSLLNWEPQTSLEKGLYLVNEWIKDEFPKLSKESWSYEHKN